jgi:hypothetical protein
MKKETYILLSGFGLIDIAEKYLSLKSTGGQMKNYSFPHLVAECEKILQYWRIDDSIPMELYSALRQFYPEPIPFPLFFSFTSLGNEIENYRWIGDLANKWLMDIFSGGSFYNKNKEYFTKSEVKHFLVCNWIQPNENKPKKCNYTDLIYHFFDAKIKANNLAFSADILKEVFH